MSEFKTVTDLSGYIVSCIAQGAKPVWAQKNAAVRARQGNVGDVVETLMSDGFSETLNRVGADADTGAPDWIVENQSGERYVMSDREFRAKYAPRQDEAGMFLPQSPPVVAVPVRENITFPTSWGSMKLRAGGVLILTPSAEVYGIQEDAFRDTYRQLGPFLP